MSTQSDPLYIMGRSEEETERLARQGELFAPAMRMVLESAGLSAGMKVLDVGSGAGDVAMLAANIVGANGLVVCLDLNPDVLKTARQRAAAAALSSVKFLDGDTANSARLDSCSALEPGSRFRRPT